MYVFLFYFRIQCFPPQSVYINFLVVEHGRTEGKSALSLYVRFFGTDNQIKTDKEEEECLRMQISFEHHRQKQKLNE
jgi:hypothetical protein